MKRVPWYRFLTTEFVWNLDLCDGGGDPSLAKGVAAYFAILTGFDMYVHGISTANCVMAAIVLSAAFGRSAWMHWLDRNTWSRSDANTTARTESVNYTEIAKAVLARRTDGIEASGRVEQTHHD